MKKQLEQRLKELKAEFASGQKMLADLEVRQMNLRETLLRISGAIQVLEEMAGDSGGDNGKTAKEADLSPAETTHLEEEVIQE